MKKRIKFRKLGRTSTEKWHMLRNMVTSLIYHERIETTEAKAKELKYVAEKVIGMSKKGNYHYCQGQPEKTKILQTTLINLCDL